MHRQVCQHLSFASAICRSRAVLRKCLHSLMNQNMCMLLPDCRSLLPDLSQHWCSEAQKLWRHRSSSKHPSMSIIHDLTDAAPGANSLILPACSTHPLMPQCCRWPDFDAASWREATQDARDARKGWSGSRLLGCDLHRGALDLAAMCVLLAGLAKSGLCQYNTISVQQSECWHCLSGCCVLRGVGLSCLEHPSLQERAACGCRTTGTCTCVAASERQLEQHACMLLWLCLPPSSCAQAHMLQCVLDSSTCKVWQAC